MILLCMKKELVNQIIYGQIRVYLIRKLTKLKLIFLFNDEFELHLCLK